MTLIPLYAVLVCVNMCVCVCADNSIYRHRDTLAHIVYIHILSFGRWNWLKWLSIIRTIYRERVREWAKFSHYCYSPPPPPLTRAQVTNHKIKLQLVSNHRRNLFNLFRFTDPFLEHANVHVRDAPVAFYPKFFFFHPSPNITAKREGHKVFCFSHVIHKITLKMEWLWQRSSSECFMVPKKKLMCAFFRWLLLFSLLVEILFTKSTT